MEKTIEQKKIELAIESLINNTAYLRGMTSKDKMSRELIDSNTKVLKLLAEGSTWQK